MSATLYSNLLHTLHAQDIPYAILRDHPQAPALRDFDLLIDRRRLDGFVSCARQHGFFLLKSGHRNPGKKVFLRWDESGAFIIDLHERLIYRGYEFLDAQRVLTRRRRVEGIDHLGFEDELLALLWHNVLGKEEIQAKHRDRLLALFQMPLDEAYLIDHLRQFGLEKLFVEIRQNFPALSRDPQLVRQIKTRALRRLRFKPLANARRRICLRLLAACDGRLGPRRGALIAFVGPDGCGKSSLTQALREEFRRATLATDIVYLGPWGQNKLPLHAVIRALHLKPFLPEEKRGEAGKLAPPGLMKKAGLLWRGTLFYLLLALELWFRYCTMVLPRLRRGRVVLADRYIYDVLIGYKNRPLAHFRRLRAWLCRRYPQPDVTILLDAEPEVIYARKPQFEVEELTYIRQAYREVARDFAAHALDTSISLEKTLAEFQRTISPILWQRWKI